MISIPASAFADFLGPTCTVTAVYADGTTKVVDVPCIYFGTDSPSVVGDASSASPVRLAFPASAWPAGSAIPPPRSVVAADTATPPRFDRLTVQRSELVPGGMVFLECSAYEAALP